MKLRLLVGIVGIPMLAAVADAAPFAYILNRGSGDVTVIDTNVYNSSNPSASVVQASLAVGTRPYSIAIAPTGNYFVVANQGNPTGRSLKLFNADTLSAIGTLSIDYVPGGMAISKDGSRLYVADQTPSSASPSTSNRVVVYALEANGSTPINYLGYLTVKPAGATGINVTMPEGVALDETSKRLFVANSGTDRIVVYDLDKINDDLMSSAFENPTGRLPDIQLATGSRPTGLAVAGGKVYVANTNANTVQAFDSVSQTLVATYESGTAPYNVTVSPDGSKVYVANAADTFDRVLVITTGTGTSELIQSTFTPGTYACSAGEAASTPPRYLVTNVQSDEMASNATDVSLISVGSSAGILIPAGVNPCSFGNFIGPKFDYTITTSATGGMVTPSQTVGAPANTVLAAAGSTKSFTFSDASNCVTDVKVDGVSIGAPSTYTIGPITKNYTLNVTFGPCTGNESYLTANIAGTGFCSVTSVPGGVTIVPPATTATAAYNSGTTVTLTASSPTGSTFAGWSGCTSVNGSNCVVNLTSDTTVTATCDLASLIDNEVLRGTTYYDTIAQAIADSTNSAAVIKAIAAPTKAIQPVTCSSTQSVKLEGMYTSKQFLSRSTTLTPVGSVTISGGCSIEFDGITIQ
ncbi:MAG: hypothetical protein Fur0034_15190 [Desulfuromonadia bacterium]